MARTIRENGFKDIHNRWAVGCTKHTASKVDLNGILLPEFKTLKRTASEQVPFRLKTDSISVKPPESHRPD